MNEPYIDDLEELCAAAYQVVGAADGPVEMLDNLSAAASGNPLPHSPYAGIPWCPPRNSRQPQLARYGVYWIGPERPICEPAENGYWTPWHIAQTALNRVNPPDPIPLSKEKVDLSRCDHDKFCWKGKVVEGKWKWDWCHYLVCLKHTHWLPHDTYSLPTSPKVKVYA